MNMLHRKKRMNDGFSISKLEISMLQTRNTENRPKNTKMELQVLLDEDDSQTQKQLAEQLSVSQQVPIAYERWERFRKSADGCHMN